VICFRNRRRRISSSNERRTQAAIREHDAPQGKEGENDTTRKKRPSKCIALPFINAKKVEKRGAKIYQTNNPKASTANNTAKTNSSSLIKFAG
jgi:hypothetical protein